MFDFTIPEEYHDKLEPIVPTDPRTDTEIFATFQDHKPVTSEKNVWVYWHAGASKMPK